MKRMKLTAVLTVFCVCVAWGVASAAQRSRLGQPAVTAVPGSENGAVDYRTKGYEGIAPSASGVDSRPPAARAQNQDGPSDAFLQEEQGGRPLH